MPIIEGQITPINLDELLPPGQRCIPVYVATYGNGNGSKKEEILFSNTLNLYTLQRSFAGELSLRGALFIPDRLFKALVLEFLPADSDRLPIEVKKILGQIDHNLFAESGVTITSWGNGGHQYIYHPDAEVYKCEQFRSGYPRNRFIGKVI